MPSANKPKRTPIFNKPERKNPFIARRDELEVYNQRIRVRKEELDFLVKTLNDLRRKKIQTNSDLMDMQRAITRQHEHYERLVERRKELEAKLHEINETTSS